MAPPLLLIRGRSLAGDERAGAAGAAREGKEQRAAVCERSARGACGALCAAAGRWRLAVAESATAAIDLALAGRAARPQEREASAQNLGHAQHLAASFARAGIGESDTLQ